MAKGLVNESSLNSIAEAINVLNGSEGTYFPSEMGAAIINAIPTEKVTDDIVSITDAAAYPAEGLEFGIEPVQDLHGYDKPWPAGGGKNLLLTTIENLKERNGGVNSWSGNEKTINGVKLTIQSDAQGNVLGILVNGTASENTNFFIITASNTPLPSGTYIGSGCPSGGENGYKINFNVNGVWAYGDTGNGVNLNGEVLGAAITITQDTNCNNLVFKPMIRLASDTDPTFEPYSNICPISGWTAVNGERMGVNVWDEEWEVGSISNSTGLPIIYSTNIRSKNFIPILPSTDYFFYIGIDKNIRYYFYNINKTFISTDAALNNTVKSPSNAYWLKIRSTSQYGDTYNHDISINYPSTDTEYHAYQGTSIPITFPAEVGTVYGGKLDVVNGKLTVDRAEVDLGTLNWIYENNFSIFRSNSTNYKKVPNSSVGNIKCSIYPSISADAILLQSLSDSAIAIGNVGAYNNNFIVKNLSYTDTAIFKTAMQGVQLVYELATPIEYDITPQQIQMLLGDNNVWCDTGDTTLEYKVDLGRYIAKLQAAQTTPQLSLSRQAVSLDAPMDETTQNEDEV